jgi:DNA-binding transcriptional ArsR family regulator
MPKRNGSGIELLADPTRRAIVAALALRPRRPSSLALELGLSRPGISRHLSLLLGAELVRVHRSQVDGRGLLYDLDPDRHGQVTAWLAGTEVGLRASISLALATREGDGSA